MTANTGANRPTHSRISAPLRGQVQSGGTIDFSNLWVNDNFAAGNPGLMAVNLSDSVGTLSILGQDGTPLAGSGTSAISFSGTFAEVNADLQRLSYTAGAAGKDTIVVNVWNQAGLSSTRAIAVTITSQPTVTRTWIGDVSNNVLDAGAWTPTGKPQPGDLLQVFTGTAKMTGGTLSGDTLILGNQYTASPPETLPNPELDLSGGAHVDTLRFEPLGPNGGATIKVAGSATIRDLDLEGGFPGGTLAVNLGDDALLHATTRNGELVTSRAGLSVTGGAGAEWSNDGPSFIYSANIDVDVVGAGSWTIGAPNTELTFGRAVAASQTVDLSGNSKLTVGDPADFHALVDFGQANSVLLEGIQGDTFTYRNDMLRIRSGGTVVETLRLHEQAGASFTISSGPSGITIGGFVGPQPESGVIGHAAT